MESSIRKKIDLNARDKFGYTAFLNACKWGNADIVQLLLHNSKNTYLDFNAVNKRGRTGLMLACKNGQVDVVLILIESIKKKYNIKLNIRDTFGKIALIIACQEEQFEIVRVIQNTDPTTGPK